MTTKAEQADGILERTDDRDVLRYERRLAHPVERVWRAITEPDEIVSGSPRRSWSHARAARSSCAG